MKWDFPSRRKGGTHERNARYEKRILSLLLVFPILDFVFSGDGLGGLHRVADAGVGTAGEDHKAFFAVKDQGGVVQQFVLFPIPIQFGDHLGVGVFKLQHPGDLPQEGEMRGEGIGAGDRNDVEIAFQQLGAEHIAHVFPFRNLGRRALGWRIRSTFFSTWRAL